MSIVKTQKNRQHSVELTLVTQVRPETPKSSHPLVFWTQNREHPIEVDLREFAEGKPEKKMGYAKERTFSGRPVLIQQLKPVIDAHYAIASSVTVRGFLSVLRHWWALLDSVEAKAAAEGKPIERVDDVRQLTLLHREAARLDQMNRETFSKFRALVDVSRLALGGKPTYWLGLENRKTEKHIPPLEQRVVVRQAIKRGCLRVIDQWDEWDRLIQLSDSPAEPKEAANWRALHYVREALERKGNLLPTIAEMNKMDIDGNASWCFGQFRIHPTTIMHMNFASRGDALAIFSQCMATTGWNVAVMLGLDVNTEFLRDHPKDDPADPNRRWVLTGIKERAKGAEQVVCGPWKASYLAGSLIARYLQRVEPLRNTVKIQLENALTRYEAALLEASNATETKNLFKQITELRRIHKSIWLFLDVDGKIAALNNNFNIKSLYDADGSRSGRCSYIGDLLDDENSKRRKQDEEAKPFVGFRESIPYVSYRDFRLWFADYLYRSSLGNLLVVMLGLGHKHLGTAQRYVNTNLVNRDAESKIFEFQEILTDELGKGRIDLTILAYKVRHGELSHEKEAMLAELRRLPKSRQGIGCKDPMNPPSHLEATPGQPCDSQRCLLCKQHAVLLPESLDGIAMREAELKAMREGLPMTSFVEGGYQVELENQEQALRLFDPGDVTVARDKWAQSISKGKHPVPGLPAIAESF